MKTITFDNLIDSKTGKAIELEVDDDTKPLKEWSDKAKLSAKGMREAFSKKELIKEGHRILDDIEENINTMFDNIKKKKEIDLGI